MAREALIPCIQRAPLGFVLGAALAVSSWSEDAAGQEICFRGKPLPECSGSAITESELVFSSGGGDLRPSWSGGYVFNLTRRHAVGGLVFAAIGGDAQDHGAHHHVAIGVRPRYRYWFREDLSLDVSPGVILWSNNDGSTLGFSGDIGLNFFDWFAPIVRLEVIRNVDYPGPAAPGMKPRGPETLSATVLSGGVRLSSYPGLIVAAGTAATYGLYYLIVCVGGCPSSN
jgi:hypothetical protein